MENIWRPREITWGLKKVIRGLRKFTWRLREVTRWLMGAT